MDCEKALGLPGRLEALHDPLASSGQLMTVFRRVAQTFVLLMLDTRHDLSLGGTVAREFVRDHHARGDALLLEQFPQQPLGYLRIAPALNQDVENDSMLVHGPP